MGGEKVTYMVIKADLQCPCCYKKIKKLLCSFPQIRDLVYDEKKNLVTITVVCCSPEKVRDKLCCKGGKVIHSIDILEPTKPKPPSKPADNQPKDPPKPDPAPPKGPPKPDPAPPKGPPKPDPAPPKDPPKPDPAPPKGPPKPDPAPIVLPPPQAPAPGPGPGGMYPVPVGYFGTPCYCGYGQCPCSGYGRPAPPRPPPCYESNYGGGGGYGAYGNSNFGKPCYASRCCDEYFSEDNASSCSIM